MASGGGEAARTAAGKAPGSVSGPAGPEPAEPSSELLPPDAMPELIGSELPYNPPPLIVPAENAEGDTPGVTPVDDAAPVEKPPETEVIEEVGLSFPERHRLGCRVTHGRALVQIPGHRHTPILLPHSGPGGRGPR